MKKITVVAAALGLTWALAACGASSGNNSQADLVKSAISAMKSGDYDALVELCSPSTRLEAAGSILMAKAFDPKGAFLKAAAAELEADFADNGVVDSPDSENDSPPMQVDGKWYLDCSE